MKSTFVKILQPYIADITKSLNDGSSWEEITHNLKKRLINEHKWSIKYNKYLADVFYYYMLIQKDLHVHNLRTETRPQFEDRKTRPQFEDRNPSTI